MMLTERTISCQDCGCDFIFTVGEQEFYKEKGFENEPKRCPDCRKSRKNSRSGREGRQLFTVTCEECGCDTQVPFEPRQGRPVYCRSCFESRR